MTTGIGGLDFMIVLPAVTAIVSMWVVYQSDKHVLPQTSSTFFLKPIRDFETGLGVKYTSKAVYDASKWRTEYDIHATAALKYARGCYGNTVLSHLKLEKDDPVGFYLALTTAQKNASGFNSRSVCSCIDDYTKLAWPATDGLGHELAQDLINTLGNYTVGVGGNITAEDMAAKRQFIRNLNLDPPEVGQEQTMQMMAHETESLPHTAANFRYHLLTEVQFTTLNDIGHWCDKTAAPQYSVQFASVINSKLLILVALSFMFLGLDITGKRAKNSTDGEAHTILALLLDMLPLVVFSFMFLQFQWTNHIQEIDASGTTNDGSFLMVMICLMIFIGSGLTAVLGFYYIAGAKYTISHVLERIYTDLPMIVGLSLLGVGLKLQNAEHDEAILVTTLFLLAGAGLLQHISSVVKTLYDNICCDLSEDVIQALQKGQTSTELASEDVMLTKTRHILQYFGWTRLYAFVIVVVFAVFSYTISSSVNTYSPLTTYTQNQYFYFLFVFVTALAGLDFAYEILPFTQEVDQNDGTAAIERMRKLAVLLYIVFTMISQYTVESQEL